MNSRVYPSRVTHSRLRVRSAVSFGLFLLQCSLVLCFTTAPSAASPESVHQSLVEALSTYAELAPAKPPGTTVYFRQLNDQYRVNRISLWADNREHYSHFLNAKEQKALASGHLMPLASLPSTTAAAEIIVRAHKKEDAPTSPASVWRAALNNNQRTDQTSLIAHLKGHAWLPWKARIDVQKPPQNMSLLAESSEFLVETDREVEAIAALWAHEHHQKLTPREALVAAKAQLQLGWDARPALEKLLPASPPVASRARLLLAENALQSGNSIQAQHYVVGIREQLPSIDHDRFEAARVLAQLQLQQARVSANTSLPKANYQNGMVALAAFSHALKSPINTDLLSHLASIEMQDETGWSVRDKINLMLGYDALRQHQPEKAEEAFARVRISGPFTSAARLGLGWSQLIPRGPSGEASMANSTGPANLRPRGDQATASARRESPFRTSTGIAYGSLAEGLRNALQPWSDLIGADPLDPAVQEAMLAIPYALGHLGSHQNALKRLRQATDALTDIHEGLERATDAAHSEGLASSLLEARRNAHKSTDSSTTAFIQGSRWWRQDQRPKDFYLERLLQNGAFQQQLRRCEKLVDANRILSSANTEATANNHRNASFHAAQSTLKREIAQCETELDEQAVVWLQHMAATTRQYLSEAHLSLARLNDTADIAALSTPGDYE